LLNFFSASSIQRPIFGDTFQEVAVSSPAGGSTKISTLVIQSSHGTLIGRQINNNIKTNQVISTPTGQSATIK